MGSQQAAMGIQIGPEMDSPVEATMWRAPAFPEVHPCVTVDFLIHRTRNVQKQRQICWEWSPISCKSTSFWKGYKYYLNPLAMGITRFMNDWIYLLSS